MRNLTVKQKKILKEWYEQHQNNFSIHNILEQLDYDVYTKLKEINDNEILETLIVNYLTDIHMNF